VTGFDHNRGLNTILRVCSVEGNEKNRNRNHAAENPASYHR
jgi:hypothetical protein